MMGKIGQITDLRMYMKLLIVQSDVRRSEAMEKDGRLHAGDP